MNRFKLYFCALLFISVYSIAQNNPTVIKVKKPICCDSLQISISKDTLKYNKLINQECFGILINNCFENASASIISFEILANNKKEFVKGNCYKFSRLTNLKSGGEIIITKCVVNCKMPNQEPKKVILPPKKIIVIP